MIDWKGLFDGKSTKDNVPFFYLEALGSKDELMLETKDGLILPQDRKPTSVRGPKGAATSSVTGMNAVA